MQLDWLKRFFGNGSTASSGHEKEYTDVVRVKQDKLLRQLAYGGDVRVREGVARNPMASEDLLADLAYDDVGTVRLNAAANPSAPASLLEELMRKGDFDSLVGVASNPSTPTELLRELSTHDRYRGGNVYATWNDTRVRSALCCNPSVPVDILSDLAKDNVIRGRGLVALNTSAPQSMLMSIAHNKSDNTE